MIKKNLKILTTFFEITFICTGVALACYFLLGQILEISGDSMYPTLKDKEHILAEKISPKFTDFKRGEIVVFYSPSEKNVLIIKRIIGLPGDVVNINFGLVYINGTALKEPYLPAGASTDAAGSLKSGEGFKVPADSYFMLGDNRNRSIDSRYWGVVKKEMIMGRALLVYKPIQNFKLIFL